MTILVISKYKLQMVAIKVCHCCSSNEQMDNAVTVKHYLAGLCWP